MVVKLDDASRCFMCRRSESLLPASVRMFSYDPSSEFLSGGWKKNQNAEGPTEAQARPIAALAECISRKTVNHCRDVLRAALNVAIEVGPDFEESGCPHRGYEAEKTEAAVLR